MSDKNTKEKLLEVRGLRTHFNTPDGVVKAVDGVSFSIKKRQTLALVGESGCGKSVTAFSILRLIPQPPGKIVAGTINFNSTDLTKLSERNMRKVRGGKISMIFQEPMSSLNPVFTCGSQIVEAIRLHRKVSGSQAKIIAIEMLTKVGIPDPAQRFKEYPHQMSGGMKQRIMIAMALSCEPDLLIADEPTTALDVTIQAQILNLLKDIQKNTGLSILLITHDLAVVAESADVVAVMYASKIVEFTDIKPLFADPLHPYTNGLFRSLPRLGQASKRLETIEGSVPNPLNFPTGCKFHPRCPLAKNDQRCSADEPELREVKPGHWAACWQCEGYDKAKPTDPTSV